MDHSHMNHPHIDHAIDSGEVAAFFDRVAPWWDETTIRDEEVIAQILDNAGVTSGCSVLDVACGTGVLFDDYFNRDVSRLVGVDISPEMVRIGKSKFDDPRLQILCGDIMETDTGEAFDCCMIYNAFPHFPDPEGLIGEMAKRLKPGGRLSIAHGLSREKLAEHHSGSARNISLELPEAEIVAAMFQPWFNVDVCISNDRMYQVCGIRL